MSIENCFRNVCRTCLTQNYHMQPLFNTKEHLKGSIIMLHEVLMSFTSLQITEGDGLPEQICFNCVDEINRVYSFRQLCEKSNNTLQHYLISPLSTSKSNIESIPDTLNNAPASDRFEEYSFETDNLVEVDNVDSLESVEDMQTIKDVFSNREDTHKYSSVSTELVIQEQRTSVESETFYCKCCQKGFKSNYLLERHKLSHRHQSEKKEITKNIQNQSSKNQSGTNTLNLPRTCTLCKKTFRFQSNLERHKLTHTGEKPYLCNVCGKSFSQSSYLKIHDFIHTGEKPYKCQMCEKSFTAPGTLVTHRRTHTGERPHACKLCGKNFLQSGYLKLHMRIHTGEKPLECKICNRRFNQKGRLNVHMRIHSGEKPFSCRECGKCFAVRGTLKKHLRTHTGEKPYVCTVCGQAFAQNGTLATHVKVHKAK